MTRDPSSAVPDAWPLLMRLGVVLAYLGDISEDTFRKIYPVRPVDLGAGVTVWNRLQLDAWVGGMPPRLPKGGSAANDAAAAQPDPAILPAVEAGTGADERRSSALERTKARAWKRSATSNASRAGTAR